MQIMGVTALVTGANRGIGRTFAEHLLQRGAAKVYVTTRAVEDLKEILAAGDSRLVGLALDVTDKASIDLSASQAKDVTLLVNNAGVAAFTGAISAVDISAATGNGCELLRSPGRYASLRPSNRSRWWRNDCQHAVDVVLD